MTDSAPPRIDLMLIGAPKCGTTWLTRRLSQHPGLCMPNDEIHYYSREYARGPGWYRDWFAAAMPGQLLAENSNSYLTEPPALPRIVAEQPDARLLCVLRNPVERAYSSYGMQIDRGRATDDIDRYLDPERSPRPHILTNGLYAAALQPWYDHFPAERILVLRFETIRSDPAGLLKRVFGFAGLDPDFAPPALDQRENARKAAGIPGPVKRALWWARPMLTRPPLRQLVESPPGRAVQAMLTRPKRYPPMTPALVARLNDYYRADIARLAMLTGEDFSGWLD